MNKPQNKFFGTWDGFEKMPNSFLENVKEVSDEDIFKTADKQNGEFNLPDNEDEDLEDNEDKDYEQLDEDLKESEEDLSNKAGDLITGEFAVELIDALIPAIIVTSMHFIGYQIEKKSLQLNLKEKKALSKATQRYLNSINVNLDNPLNNLILVAVVIYGSKVIGEIPNIKKIDKKVINIKEKQIEEIKELAKPTDEQLFNDAFDKLADEVVTQGRKKTRSAAKKMLLKENLDAVNKLRKDYGLSEILQEEEFQL